MTLFPFDRLRGRSRRPLRRRSDRLQTVSGSSLSRLIADRRRTPMSKSVMILKKQSPVQAVKALRTFRTLYETLLRIVARLEPSFYPNSPIIREVFAHHLPPFCFDVPGSLDVRVPKAETGRRRFHPGLPFPLFYSVVSSIKRKSRFRSSAGESPPEYIFES